jgi:putative phosphoesterase
MLNILDKHKNADYLIHLGDLERDIEEISYFSDIKILSVRGNCDFGSVSAVEGEEIIEGKRIFYTHGHTYYVKHGYENIYNEGLRRQADIILFGHTHHAINEYRDGVYLFNPGSLSLPDDGKKSYGIIDIVNGQISTNIVKL